VSEEHGPAQSSSMSTESMAGSVLWVLAISAGLGLAAWIIGSAPVFE